MASTSEIRKGLCLRYNNDIYSIVEFQHVKPGKGPAFVRTRMKSLTIGKVIDNTWPSGHNIDIVRVERRKFQYLYNDESGYHFMDNETYEQVSLNEDLINNTSLLKEGQEVEVLFDAEKEVPLTCELPQYVILEVTYAEPGVKGDTATNASKMATVETGANISVPLFINEGEKIRIDTDTNSYMDRIKE